MVNRQPPGDVWKLPDTDPRSQNYGKTYIAEFSYIHSLELKIVFKSYIWDNYRTGNRATSALYLETITFKKFIKFACVNGINSFMEMTNNEVSKFVSFLHTEVSAISGKSFSYAYQKSCLDTLKAVVRWCQIHDPSAVPPIEIFMGNEYKGLGSSIRVEFIPDEIMAKVNLGAKTEPNFYLKYGMVILNTTGMRVGDLMKLRIDCMQTHPVSGYTMKWFDHKRRKDRPPLPVPKNCADAVNTLLKKTDGIRLLADEKIKHLLFIFIPQKGKYRSNIISMSNGIFSAWLHGFAQQNGIIAPDGKPYSLTPHKFRRTLATDMFSKDVSLKVIQEVLGHGSPMVTRRHYADVKAKEYAGIFDRIGIIGNINEIDRKTIPDIIDLNWFRDNVDTKARMCDGYCTQPFAGQQICERLLNHQKCYMCSRFVTTPEFLETHKVHLRELEEQLEQNVYGEHYAAHFKPVIEILKEIICRLEAMKK